MLVIYDYWHIILIVSVAIIICILMVSISAVLIEKHIFKITEEKRKEYPELRIKTGKFIAQLLIAISVIFGFILTRETFKHNQETLKLHRETLNLDKMDRVTERFFKAVQALSKRDENGFDERIAGIHTLSEIAKKEQGFTRPVIQVLSNHVMEHYPYPRKSEDSNRTMMARDVQSILNEINWIKKDYYDKECVLDGKDVCDQKERNKAKISTHLWMTDLRGAYLEEFDLQKIWFSCSDLTGSKMRGADLSGAVFAPYERPYGHMLIPAILDNVDLNGATLINTRLEWVNLKTARNLTNEQIEQACINEGTELLPAFDEAKEKRIEQIREKNLCNDTRYIRKFEGQSNNCLLN